MDSDAILAYQPAGEVDSELHPVHKDRWGVGLGMTAAVIILGWAINLHSGAYTLFAIRTLSFALLCCVISIAWPSAGLLRRMRMASAVFWFIAGSLVIALVIAAALYAKARGDDRADGLAVAAVILCLSVVSMLLPPSMTVQRLLSKSVIILAVGGIALDLYQFMLMPKPERDRPMTIGLLLVGAVAVIGLIPVKWIKHVAVVILLGAFAYVGWHGILRDPQNPKIDVYDFQKLSSADLMQGKSPYSTRYPNIYTPDKTVKYYGPGVVDKNDMLTYGFPYPPLSLLMVAPAVKWGGDCRYSLLAALVISAGLMAYARPGKLGLLAAALFLLMPRTLFVVTMAWTEPLLVLTFSLALFCACRWRRALPFALGLFFATKQYSILSLPLLILLTEGPGVWRQLWVMVVKAGLVAAAVTVPFFAWDPREFWRAIVQWQFVQPFREDALSYLVWMHEKGVMGWVFRTSDGRPRTWIPLAAIVPALGVSLWRCARSPAGFAAGVTLVNFVFFAFNKQAFCNYYFFVIATACWSIAAIAIPIHDPAGSSR